MAINVIGFRWGDSDENHKYDYNALENKPTADLGVLDIDTTAEQGTDDGDLYRAIHSISWDNVINTLSGVLNVKKLFTRLVNQVKTNTDTLSDPGQLVEDAIGSYDTASSVVSSDMFIKKENDGEIKQVTPLNVLKGGVRGLNRTASYSDKDVPIISTSDTSDISKSSTSTVTKAGLYNLATGSASELSADLSDKIVIETPPDSGALEPAYIEKHQLSEIYNLFAVGNKVDMTDSKLNITSTSSGTTDGDLYDAINKNGWGSVVSNQLMDLKKLLTDALEIIKRIPDAIAIPSTGMDLNTIAGTRCYYASGNAFAANCTNCPTKLAFRLWMIPVSQPFFVTPGAEWQYYIQLIVDMGGNVYIRDANTGAAGSSMRYGSWSKILGQKIPSIAVTNISGGTLVAATIYNGSDSVCQGLIRVTTNHETAGGGNFYTATVKIDGVNADGLGVTFNGSRAIIGTLSNGTLTVRNASGTSLAAGDVTMAMVFSKRII